MRSDTVVQIEPLEGPLCGKVHLPFSKSLSARQLLLGAHHGQPFRIWGLSDAQDTQDLVTVLTRAGYAVTFSERSWFFRPTAPTCSKAFYVGEGGTTLRFLLPWLAFQAGTFRLVLSPSLAKRPLWPLIKSLQEAGAQIAFMGSLIEVKGNPDWQPTEFTIDASQSGQFVSALLLAAPRLPSSCVIRVKGGRVATPSYVEMTRCLLARYGYVWQICAEGWHLVQKPPTPPLLEFQGEFDWSSGSYFWAWALLTEARLELPLSMTSLQPEHSFWPAFASGVSWRPFQEGLIELTSKSEALPVYWQGDISEVPDTFPTLAVLGALAKTPWQIYGVHALPYKESHRLQAMAQELAKIGAHLSWRGNFCTITPTSKLEIRAPFEAHGDHRLALALSLLSAKAARPITLRGAQTVSKSFPSYWRVLKSLGLKLSFVYS